MRRTILLPRPAHLALLMCSLLCLNVGTAEAQVPSSAQADRAREQVITPENLSPDSADNMGLPDMGEIFAPEGADQITFVLREFSIDGVTVYTPAELAPFYQPYIGQTISLTRVYDIAARINQKYRQDGYLITQVVVPEQTIDGGRVRLQVVEGALEDVSISGELTQRDRPLVASYGNKLTQSAPLRADQMERYLLLLNDIPGMSARSIIGPSNIPGKADIEIAVDRTPANFLLSADNYGSKYLGPLQLTAAAQLNNPFRINDRLVAQVVHAPDDQELTYSYLAYDLPVGNEGTRLTVDGTYSDTAPGFDIAFLDPKGYAAVLGTTVSHPFIRTRHENLNGFARFDYQNTGTSNNLGVKTKDNIRSLRIGGNYELLSKALGTSVNTVSAQLSRGLDIMGASDQGDLDLSRPSGNPQYTKFEVEFSRLQNLRAGLNALVAVKGQRASGALLSSEEFGLGGMTSGYGRGYDPSEITGDHGLAGKAELQWSPAVLSRGPVQGAQVYAFYDVGSVWDDDATVASDERLSLASTGLGFRAGLGAFTAHATAAVPLTRDVGVEADTDPRLFFSVAARF